MAQLNARLVLAAAAASTRRALSWAMRKLLVGEDCSRLSIGLVRGRRSKG